VGPYAFNNEYVFAPSLHFPTAQLRVNSLMLKKMFFKSTAVQMSVFPWTLQGAWRVLCFWTAKTVFVA
jgi:hypothetical protein